MMINSLFNNSHIIFSQYSDTESDTKEVDSKDSENKTEESTLESLSSNEKSTSCFEKITYPFVKIKEVVIGIFKHLFNLFCCCFKPKLNLSKEHETLINLKDLLNGYPPKKQKDKDEMLTKIKNEISNLQDIEALKTYIFIGLLEDDNDEKQARKELKELLSVTYPKIFREWMRNQPELIEKYKPKVEEILNNIDAKELRKPIEEYRKEVKHLRNLLLNNN